MSYNDNWYNSSPEEDNFPDFEDELSDEQRSSLFKAPSDNSTNYLSLTRSFKMQNPEYRRNQEYIKIKEKEREDEEFLRRQLNMLNLKISNFREQVSVANNAIRNLENKNFLGDEVVPLSILEPIKNYYFPSAKKSYNAAMDILSNIGQRLGTSKRMEIETQYNINDGFREILNEMLQNIFNAVESSRNLGTPKIKSVLETLFKGFKNDFGLEPINIGLDVSFEEINEGFIDSETTNLIIESLKRNHMPDDYIVNTLINDYRIEPAKAINAVFNFR